MTFARVLIAFGVAVSAMAAVQGASHSGASQSGSGKSALIVALIQDCFMEGGSLAVAGSDALIPVVNDITANYGDEFALTVFVQDTHPPEHTSFASTHGLPDLYNYPEGIPMLCTMGPSGEPSCCPDSYCPLPEDGCQVHSLTVNETFPCCGAANHACAVCFGDDSDASCVPYSQTMWPEHCLEDGDSAFPAALNLDVSNANVLKKGYYKYIDEYSAFVDVAGLKTTELHNWLESAGVTQIFLTGLTVENGIKTTALDAVKLGYTTYVITDATASVTEEGKLAATTEMSGAGVSMVTASDLLQLLLEKEEPEPPLPGDEPKAGDSTSSASVEMSTAVLPMLFTALALALLSNGK